MSPQFGMDDENDGTIAVNLLPLVASSSKMRVDSVANGQRWAVFFRAWLAQSPSSKIKVLCSLYFTLLWLFLLNYFASASSD